MKPAGPRRWIRFLAAHEKVQRFLSSVLRTRLCEKAVELACRLIALRYGSFDLDRGIRWLKNFRNFSENTGVNALNEMYEKSSRGKRMIWLSGIFDDFDPERKARFLKRLFYNIILNGIERRIIRTRMERRKGGIPNLSALLLATSSHCNLDCAGCESRNDRKDQEASAEQLEYVIQQAKRLHVFHIVIIGKGEPLEKPSSRRKIIDLMKVHWDLNFILFTNGTTIEDEDIAEMATLDNLFLFVSIDGTEKINDSRRGKGTYRRILATMDRMRRHGLFYGFSTTAFKQNYHHVLSPEFIGKMMEMGCRLGLYLTYWPVDDSSNGKMKLGDEEYVKYETLLKSAARQAPVPLIDPEIFERDSGCRAKRGSLVYIDCITGRVMPCVKAPFSEADCNIYSDPHPDRLLDVLKTDFFTRFRNGSGSCAWCSLSAKQV